VTPRRRLHGPSWTLGVALLAVVAAAEVALVVMTGQHRSARFQERVDAATGEAAVDLRQRLTTDLRYLVELPDLARIAPAQRDAALAGLLAVHPELLRIEQRASDGRLEAAFDSRGHAAALAVRSQGAAGLDAEQACAASRRRTGPAFSEPYFVPTPDGRGLHAIDLCITNDLADEPHDALVLSIELDDVLDQMHAAGIAPDSDMALLSSDGSRVAHGSLHVGAGVFRATRPVVLPGSLLQIQLDSEVADLGLVPDLFTAFSVAVSLALVGVMVALGVDMRRRSRAERALAEALALRQAIEASVTTGLRARDLTGRVTYVNPAFCDMVGFGADELLGQDPPPYWPRELHASYLERKASRLAAGRREAFEAVFTRKNGERFPVMVMEAPLMSADGDQAGWVGAIVDLTQQRLAEETRRLQQDRLQATARLASMGEMASLIGHEISQPVAAIAAYATGSLNMLSESTMGAEATRDAFALILEQAERAARVIRSVNDFVRRRDGAQEAVTLDELLAAIAPLIRLQAERAHTAFDVDLPASLPAVRCDRAMIEQVLLNLIRNAIQASEESTTASRRVRLEARGAEAGRVRIRVSDSGPGIADDVAPRLFTPFFSTRRSGMGLGLHLCRSVVERHGSILEFANRRDDRGRAVGTEFWFTLAADGAGTAAVRAQREDGEVAPASP
jgi:two-component system sensor histidine kinase DctS